MKVSIITATFNSENTVETCIRSVLNQSYNDIEYIIVDGGSRDTTLEKINELTENNSNVICSSEPDKGIYDALNKGISKATGDIIGFVHSDDYLSNAEVITKIVDVFNTQYADGVYGDLHYVAVDNTDKIIRNWISNKFDFKLLKKGWMPAHPTLYLKSELYKRNGGFDLSYSIAADYDFILRIFKQVDLKFCYLPETIVVMRVGGASNKSLRNIIRKTKEDYRAVKTNKTGNWLTILRKNVSKIKQFVK